MTLLAFSVPGYNNIQTPSGVPTGGLSTSGTDIIQFGIKTFLIVAVLLALFFLMFGSIQWISSGGDKAKLDAARAKITYAIIGLVIAFLGFVIVRVVAGVLGLQNII